MLHMYLVPTGPQPSRRRLQPGQLPHHCHVGLGVPCSRRTLPGTSSATATHVTSTSLGLLVLVLVLVPVAQLLVHEAGKVAGPQHAATAAQHERDALALQRPTAVNPGGPPVPGARIHA